MPTRASLISRAGNLVLINYMSRHCFEAVLNYVSKSQPEDLRDYSLTDSYKVKSLTLFELLCGSGKTYSLIFEFTIIWKIFCSIFYFTFVLLLTNSACDFVSKLFNYVLTLHKLCYFCYHTLSIYLLKLNHDIKKYGNNRNFKFLCPGSEKSFRFNRYKII